MVLDCLQNFIGLTDKTCACYPTDGAIVNVSESTTGVFLTDFINLKIAGVTDCDTAQDMWSKMYKAIRYASHDFVQTYTGKIDVKYDRSVTYKGKIGNKTPVALNGVTGALHGVRLEARRVSGHYLEVKSIDVRSNSSETGRKIYVIDTYGNVLHTSEAFDLTNSQYTTVEINKNFTLNDNIEELETQYIYILTDTENLTVGTDSGCGCGTPAYRKYFEPKGASCADASSVASSVISRNAHGMILDLEAGCNLVESICEFGTDEMKTNVARWVGARAANTLSTWVMQESLINSYTILGVEELIANTALNAAVEAETMQWLNENAELPSCFACKPGIRVSTIRT